MKDRYTDDDVRRELRIAIERAGSMRKFALSINVSATQVSQVLARELPPGPRIAAALGFAEDGYRWVRSK